MNHNFTTKLLPLMTAGLFCMNGGAFAQHEIGNLATWNSFAALVNSDYAKLKRDSVTDDTVKARIAKDTRVVTAATALRDAARALKTATDNVTTLTAQLADGATNGPLSEAKNNQESAEDALTAEQEQKAGYSTEDGAKNTWGQWKCAYEAAKTERNTAESKKTAADAAYAKASVDQNTQLGIMLNNQEKTTVSDYLTIKDNVARYEDDENIKFVVDVVSETSKFGTKNTLVFYLGVVPEDKASKTPMSAGDVYAFMSSNTITGGRAVINVTGFEQATGTLSYSDIFAVLNSLQLVVENNESKFQGYNAAYTTAKTEYDRLTEALPDLETAKNSAATTYTNAVNLVTNLEGQEATYTAQLNDKQQAVNTAKTSVATVKANLESQKSAAETEKATAEATHTAKVTEYGTAYHAAADDAIEAQLAVDKAGYNSIKFTADLDLTTEATTLTKTYVGNVIGGDNIVTIGSGSLFAAGVTGEVSHLGVNGGSIVASEAGATLTNCAYASAKKAGYNKNASVSGSTTNVSNAFGETLTSNIDNFGWDVTNKKLSKTAGKVYAAKSWTNNGTSNIYVNVVDKGVVYEKTSDEPATNKFVQLDAKYNHDFNADDITSERVIYATATGEDLYCHSINLVDKADFYCPADITVGTVTYDRTFASGWNSVCLPFAIKKTTGVDFTQATKWTDTRCTLTLRNSIEANQPYFINVTGSSWTIPTKNNVTIAATPTSLDERNGIMFGTYTSTSVATLMEPDMDGEAKWTIFGLNAKGKVAKYKEGTTFPAFRAYIRGQFESEAASNVRVREVVVEDEDGNLVTAINGVNGDATHANASVKPVQGGVVVTVDADKTVNIYTVGGAMVKSVSLEAGATEQINLPAGLYIVEGQKVAVK